MVSFRHFLYRHNLLTTKHFDVPVIVAGNITVGGTGKTPFIIWLAHLLKQQGYQPGIVSRGYLGRQVQPCLVTAESMPEQVGDEAVLLYQETGCPVVVARQRIQAVEFLLANSSCNVVLSDDGLQHYALARDIEIAIIDGERRFDNGYCLPAGPLREPISRLKSVDFVICNGGKALAGEVLMQLTPGNVCNLLNPQQNYPLSTFAGKVIHAMAGIGNPQRFFNVLKQQGLTIIEHAFPDHHAFTAEDLDFGEAIVLMTQKDAVKCKAFASQNHWYLPVQAELKPELTSKLLSCLARLSRASR